MNNAAIEAAAWAIEATMFAPHELPLDAGLHAKYFIAARAAIAAYEAASNPQHARAISILRRIVNGYRPAHGSKAAWNDALELLREVDGVD